MQIKLLPENERPVEKAWQYGVDKLSNAELLALIVHTGTKNKSALRLAEEILSTFPDGINGLGCCSKEDISHIDGMGRFKTMTVLAAVEIGKRISTSPGLKKVRASCSEDVATLFMEDLRYRKKEYFKSVLVNTKGEVIAVEDVSVGGLTGAVVHPREAFVQAVRKSAAAIIFVHNHPSGDPTASNDDIITTNRLIEVGQILGIKVLDHIIIGNGKYYSFRDEGRIP